MFQVQCQEKKREGNRTGQKEKMGHNRVPTKDLANLMGGQNWPFLPSTDQLLNVDFLGRGNDTKQRQFPMKTSN